MPWRKLCAISVATASFLAVPAAAGAAPSIGRWVGSGSHGFHVSFDVERAQNHEVLTDYVTGCPAPLLPAFADGWDGTGVPNVRYPIGRDGRLRPGPRFGPFKRKRIIGRLGLAGGALFKQYPCASRKPETIHVHHVDHFLAVQDGMWQLTGEEGTSITFWVIGGGTVIEPVGGPYQRLMYGGYKCDLFSCQVPCGAGVDLHIPIGSSGQLDLAGTNKDELTATGTVTSPTTAEGTYQVHVGGYVNCTSDVLPWSAHWVGGPAPAYLLQTPGELQSSQGCRDVLVVGARGSGESTTSYQGMGILLDQFAQKLATRLGYAQVGAEGLPYPADRLLPLGKIGRSSYNGSVQAGVRSLLTLLQTRAAACPHELIVLAGYSQGAQVVGDALAKTAPGNVVAVELFGDPLYAPGSPSDRSAGIGWGFFNLRHTRNRPPREWVPLTESWCNKDDIVCHNFYANSLAAHGDYAKWLSSAADFAIKRIEAKLAG